MVNPKLGSFFAIFTSACIALVLLVLIGEHLGAPTALRSWALLLGPMIGYAIIGSASATRQSLEYFAAGRRVPAAYSGFALALSAFGGTGLVAITGTLYLVGFDALCLVIGGLAGFVVMGILLAPFFRKFGAYTIPTYLGRRFDSTLLRVVSALILAVPLTLMMVAEIKMAAFSAGFLTGASQATSLILIAATMLLTLTSGGTRSLTWSSVAQTIASLLALMIPVTIVAVMWTNLPLPQLSHGPLMRTMAYNEAVQGLPILFAQGLAFDLPNSGLSAISKRFATTFSAVGPAGFVAATLTIMMGVAASPWLLPRIATTPGVYQARKSLGWATLLFGILMLTAASIAVYSRMLLFDTTVTGTVPDWLRLLETMGYADVDIKPLAGSADQTRNLLTNMTISRDVVLFALPMAAGLSQTFVAVAVAGAIAACLSGASAAAAALAASLAEDVVNGTKAEPPPDPQRLALARMALIAVIGLATALAMLIPADSLALLLCSLALTGSSFFPILVLSIWWKRTNAFGAVAGLVSGFAVALLAILTGWMGWLSFDPALAGIFGIPASFSAAIAASLATPHPGRHERELLRDIRVPGGEILYDREMRLLRLKKRQRASDPV
ncbi:MAG: sodium:solute symporter [Hyphomicrobiaceae bacterium]